MGTVSALEAVWTLVALPGLYLWARSVVDAQKTMRAVKSMQIIDGRRTVAKMATGLTRTMVGVELVFFGVGVLATTRAPAPEATALSQLLVAGAFIGASVGLTVLAFRWRRAEAYLLRESEQRSDDRAALAAERTAQLAREAVLAAEHAVQMVRGTAQDVRSVGQDERTTDQDARGVGQDERDRDLDARSHELDERTEGTP